ncbi:META domain-containing protein [Flavobacteriaceae bacterium]|nr:META domain-containing protein [Flavobacteriaceae bacterium]
MKKIVLTSIALCLLICGCNQTKKVVADTPPALLSEVFTVLTINGEKISPTAVLQFNKADNKIWGNAGCNDFSGKYTQDGNALNIGQLASTKMYCEGAMKNEFAIQRVLKNVGSFDISNGTLTLYSGIEKKPLLTALKNKQ